MIDGTSGYESGVPRLLRPRRGTPDSRLGVRLAFAGGAVFLVAVPVSLLWVLVRSQSEGLTDVDTRVALEVTSYVRQRPALEETLEVLARVTSPWNLRAIALVVAVLLWVRGRRRLAIWLAVTMAVGGALGFFIKLLVQRARPAIDEPLATAGGYSFPSGHALNSMLFAAAMLVLASTFLTRPWRIVCWVGAVLLVVVTGFDRIGLGVHYASDVVGGWAVGLATVLGTVAAFDAWRRAERPATRAGEPRLLTPPDDSPGAHHPVRDMMEGKKR